MYTYIYTSTITCARVCAQEQPRACVLERADQRCTQPPHFDRHNIHCMHRFRARASVCLQCGGSLATTHSSAISTEMTKFDF